MSFGIALYLEYVQHLEPCPLCMLTRVVVLCLMGLFVVGFIHNPKRKGIVGYALISTLLSLTGAAISIRHLWLQSLPPELAPSCGPGIRYLLQTLPFGEALMHVLQGSGECAAIQWRFLGLTIPGWSLVLFVLPPTKWLS